MNYIYILFNFELFGKSNKIGKLRDFLASARAGGNASDMGRSRSIKRRATSVDERPSKIQANVPTSNSYNILGSSKSNRKVDSNKSVAKPAPITITSKNNNIKHIFKEMKVNYKIISIGTKIFCENESDRLKAIKLLETNKLQYFTHPSGKSKVFKVVLCGLPELNTDLILESLKDKNNIIPVNISMFKSDSDNKLYLLHFHKNEVSKADLQCVKVVHDHIVKWRPFKPNIKGPTQCFKCGMFGHGATHCGRGPSCLQCGCEHETKDCPHASVTNENEPFIYKCVNCANRKLPSNHKATDSSCPARLDYIAIRRKGSISKNLNSRNSISANYTNERFNNPNVNQRQTFADVLKTKPSTSIRQKNVPNVNNHFTNNNLWNFTEITEILFECIDELSQCKNKLDQLRIIARLLQNACI